MVTEASKISNKVSSNFNLEPQGRRATYDKIYIGRVRNVKDNGNMGRIWVYIPEISGPDDDKVHWIPCDYASPFAGASNILDLNANNTSGQNSYGMTFIPPDENNQVLVGFANGDPNKGFWFACLFHTAANSMVPSTPASNSAQNLEKNKITGNVAPDQPATVAAKDAGTISEPLSKGGPATKSMADGITTMGIRTPQGHSIVFEDDPKNGYVRLQTRYGAQILMNSNVDNIIINTGSGKCKIVLDHEGNIDVYAYKDISFHAEKDINIQADHDINIQAGNNFNIRTKGENHWYSQKDFHIKSIGNMFLDAQGEMHRKSDSNILDKAGGNISRRATLAIKDASETSSISAFAHAGDILFTSYSFKSLAYVDTDFTSLGSTNINAGLSCNIQTGLTFNLDSASDVRLQSGTKFNIKTNNDLLIQSVSGNISSESALNTTLFSLSNMYVQSNGDFNVFNGGTAIINANGNINLRAGNSVYTSVDTHLNVVSTDILTKAETKVILPDNSITADVAPEAPDADIAQGAIPPATHQLVVTNITDSVAPTRTLTTTDSVLSRIASADPQPVIFNSGPGYSNTGLVQRKDGPPESTFKIGQIDSTASKPLQVIGIVEGGKLGRYPGKSWDSSGKPVYDAFQAMPNTVFRKASEYSGVSADGLLRIQQHEGTGGKMPDRPGGVFQDACGQGILLIGYGHRLSQQEISSKQITIISGDPATAGAVTTVNLTSLPPPYPTDPVISTAQMKDLLLQDIKPVEDKIKSSIANASITQEQFDVLADFIYLIGIDNFDKSGIASFINNGDYNKVPNEMIRWIIACDGTDRPELKSRQQENAYRWSGDVRADFVGGAPGVGNATLAKSDKARSIYCYLVQKGFNPAVASGIIGNLMWESNLSSTILGPSGDFGLAQWLGSRKTLLQSLPNYTSYQTQMDYLLQELSTSERRSAASLGGVSATDPAAAAYIFYKQFERPAASDTSGPNRQQNALLVYQNFANDTNACSSAKPLTYWDSFAGNVYNAPS